MLSGDLYVFQMMHNCVIAIVAAKTALKVAQWYVYNGRCDISFKSRLSLNVFV